VERRAAWRVSQLGFAPEKLIFLDEFAANTKMTRSCGRAPIGERVVDKVPHGHWKSTTFLMGLRSTGLIAPLAIDGAMNGDLFVAYVTQQLAPLLHPGDILVLDNLVTHKRLEARTAIEARGATLLFLPPYSPDFNPIEQAISKMKRKLRDAKQRTVEGLWNCFSQLFDQFSRDECLAYFRNSGYRYS
jgi:transposase